MSNSRIGRLCRRFLILSLAIIPLAACSRNGETIATDGNDTNQSDHPGEVKLVGYLIGEAPKGMPAVLDAINAKLKKDINATIELNYIGWNNLTSKYPTMLSNGENIDFVFAADWNDYVTQAARGAFYPLSYEMLSKHMPRHMEKLPREAIEAAKVGGIPYMIPTASPDRKVMLALFRKDIMAESGMTEIRKFSDIEPYLATVKNDHPGMIPLNLDSQKDLPLPYMFLLNEKIAWPGAPFDSGDPLAQGIVADMEDASGVLKSAVDEPFLDVQKYAARKMKSWYDAGFINKNPFANDTPSKDNFCNGESGIAFGNSIDTVPIFSTCKEKGIDVYPFPLLTPSGKASQSSWLVNGVAIPANSKHPERTLEALDLIMEDPSYAYLAYYGIEGQNYVITGNGEIGLPAGVTSESNTYPPDASGFWFVNKALFSPMETWTREYVELQGKIDSYLVNMPYTGFTFNSQNYESEVASLKSISTQYAQPIYIGAVHDVDAAFDALTAKLNGAGIEKVKTEVQKQGSAYLKNKTK
ncbi:ABC transporter substrate-binding protein [Cohnella sp. GCM10012308]|uniref:ABC transporter substrate-binding protein n=1 Tax=Cohnella sp. GCM10012308 TaxID=3317329 RepID=UPI0036077039